MDEHDDFRVPKTRVSATVELVGDEPFDADMFVSTVSPHRAGAERPSELLNGVSRFLPLVTPNGARLVNVDALLMLSISSEHEFQLEELMAEDLAAEASVTVDVEMRLVSGRHLRGMLIYLQPPGSRRVVDYLNVAPRFIALREGDTAHLINTSRIASVIANEGRKADKPAAG